MQVWKNLTLEGLLSGSNILLIMIVDEMAKSAELKSDEELKVNCYTFTNTKFLNLFEYIVEIFTKSLYIRIYIKLLYTYIYIYVYKLLYIYICIYNLYIMRIFD